MQFIVQTAQEELLDRYKLGDLDLVLDRVMLVVQRHGGRKPSPVLSHVVQRHAQVQCPRHAQHLERFVGDPFGVDAHC